MVARAECLLRIEHDLDVLSLECHSLPTRPDHNPPTDPNRPDRLSPLPIPILIRQFLNTNIALGREVWIESQQRTAQMNMCIQTPLLFRPIEMDHPVLLPPALNHGISQPAEYLCRINRGSNLDIDPPL